MSFKSPIKHPAPTHETQDKIQSKKLSEQVSNLRKLNGGLRRKRKRSRQSKKFQKKIYLKERKPLLVGELNFNQRKQNILKQ